MPLSDEQKQQIAMQYQKEKEIEQFKQEIKQERENLKKKEDEWPPGTGKGCLIAFLVLFCLSITAGVCRFISDFFECYSPIETLWINWTILSVFIIILLSAIFGRTTEEDNQSKEIQEEIQEQIKKDIKNIK